MGADKKPMVRADLKTFFSRGDISFDSLQDLLLEIVKFQI
jgi:hypothetical protein